MPSLCINAERATNLYMQASGQRSERYDLAMKEYIRVRERKIAETGQYEYEHQCTTETRIY